MAFVDRKHAPKFVVNRSNILFYLLLMTTMVSVINGADITYKIKEEQPKDTRVGNIGEDYDLRSTMTVNEFNNLNYGILSSGNIFAAYFRIANNTGSLNTTTPIDRENITQCVRSLVCVLPLEIAVQATIGAFFRKIKVDIIIEDINDNSPIFPKGVDIVQFYENSAEGTFASITGAQDKDYGNNSVVGYHIDTPDVPFYVTFEKYPDGSSFVNIVLNGSIDREIRDFYQFKVVALDGGDIKRSGSVLVNVTILDVNDNSPKFNCTFYNVTVMEDVAINAVLTTIYATDADLGDNGEVEYKLSPNQGENIKLFAVNLISGNLSVTGKLVYIPNELIQIYVDASDKGVQSRTSQIVVYVYILNSNNNPPQINVNILQSGISEYANVGAVVALVAVVDVDTGRNGKVDCVCNSDNFGLERYDINEYKAVVIKTLDRELRNVHEIKIVCQDNGSPPLNSTASVMINVLDENDNAPRFTQRTSFARSEENNKVGDVVATVSAIDIDTGDNARLEYELLNIGEYRFWIDQVKGEIRANFVLDRENTSQITFTVLVHDFGKPRLTATATVILSVLDQNDNFPVFSQTNYEFLVYEEIIQNTTVDQVKAYDSDYGANGSVVFSLRVRPPSSFPFILYSDGTIKIVRRLDREIQSAYTFSVVAADQGSPPLSSSVTVTVIVLDVNDNAPVFVFPNSENNTVTIPLSSTPESVTIVVSATDKDEGVNAQIMYSFQDVNQTSLFFIENGNGLGIIRLRQMPGTHNAMSYKLAIMATDNGTPKQSTIESLTISFTKTVLADDNKQNFLIAICLGCVTVVLSIAIVLTIYLIRRHDKLQMKGFSNYNNSPDMEIVPSDTKTSEDLGSVSSGSKESLKKVSFSIDHNSSLESENHKYVPVAPFLDLNNIKVMENGRAKSTVSTPRSGTPNHHEQNLTRLDSGSVLQIRSVMQSRDQFWASQKEGHTSPLTTDNVKHHEDNGSESSGETATYDSGRGGSESDIQTSLSQSHDTGHLKKVTFLHNHEPENQWQNACEQPINNLHNYNHKLHKCVNSKPTLPARDYTRTFNSYSHPNKHKETYGNKHSPINEFSSHMTSFDDDDDTTTSGSYTIDNDREWTNDSHLPRKCIQPRNETYS